MENFVYVSAKPPDVAHRAKQHGPDQINAHVAAAALVVKALQAQGHRSLMALAAGLNAAGMQTRRGGRWYVSTVRKLQARIDRLEGADG